MSDFRAEWERLRCGLGYSDFDYKVSVFVDKLLGAALPPQTGNPPPDPLSDEQLLEAFVAGCNAENELNDAELSPQNVRKGVAAAMRGALRGNL